MAEPAASVEDLSGRQVIFTERRIVRTVKLRTERSFSFIRFLRLLLAWLGIPVGAAAMFALPPGEPLRILLAAWFWTGLAMLLLTAAGVVPLRQRTMVREESETETG